MLCSYTKLSNIMHSAPFNLNVDYRTVYFDKNYNKYITLVLSIKQKLRKAFSSLLVRT